MLTKSDAAYHFIGVVRGASERSVELSDAQTLTNNWPEIHKIKNSRKVDELERSTMFLELIFFSYRSGAQMSWLSISSRATLFTRSSEFSPYQVLKAKIDKYIMQTVTFLISTFLVTICDT